MKINSIPRGIFVAGSLLQTACVTTTDEALQESTLPVTKPRASMTYSKPKAPKKIEEVPTILIREWSYRDGREFRDRNGDGIIDYQATGSARLYDGFGIYKEDNDFDGFYDREYEFGGYAGQMNYDKKIHEPVSRLHKVYPPTKVTRIPKPQPKAEQGVRE